MKRTILLIFLLVTAIILISCKGDTGAPGAPAADGAAVMILQNGISPYPAWSGISDTVIFSGNPSYNHGSCTGLQLGYYNSTGFYISRILMKADLSVIDPAGVTIVDAYLKFYVYSVSGTTTITAYALNTNWSEGAGPCGTGTTTDSTWNNSATGLAWSAPGGNFTATAASDSVVVSTPGFYTLKLNTAMVQNWATTPAQNFGIILKGTNETSGFDSPNITSADSGTEYGPKFTLYYRLP